MRSIESCDIITFGSALANIIKANRTVNIQYKVFVFFIMSSRFGILKFGIGCVVHKCGCYYLHLEGVKTTFNMGDCAIGTQGGEGHRTSWFFET